MLKNNKNLKNTQLAIRMGREAVDDFNSRVGTITENMNKLIDRKIHNKLKKNLVYQVLLEKCLADFEKLAMEQQFKKMKNLFKKLKFPEYHK